MSLLSTCTRSAKLGIKYNGLEKCRVSVPSKSTRATLATRSKLSNSGRCLTSLRPNAIAYGYNSALYKSSMTRCYSQETTEVAKEQVNLLPSKDRIPRAPLVITAISVIPFVACSIIPFAFPFEIAGKALFMQMTYGAVSLSMLGSVHWGLALGEYKRVDGVATSDEATVASAPSTSDQALRYVGGVLPGLAAWIFMTQAPLMGMLGLMSGFTLLALFELGAHQARLLPSWYVRMRVPWTITVLLSLGINLIHLL